PRTSRMATSSAFLSRQRVAICLASASAAGLGAGGALAGAAAAAALAAAPLPPRPGPPRFLGPPRPRVVLPALLVLFDFAGLIRWCGRRTLAHLAAAVDHVLLGGELSQAHGAEGVEAGGGDADLRAQPQLAAVVEAGGGVDDDARRGHLAGE